MAYRYLLRAFTGSSALLICLTLPAHAHAAEPKTWYVGATTNDSHVEVYRGLGWEPAGEERGFAVLGGWHVNRRFAVELGALRVGNLEWTEYLAEVPGYFTAHTTFDTTALQASGVVTFQWGQTVEAYLKVGLAQYRVDGRQVLDTLRADAALTRDVDASGPDTLLGAGLGIKATPKIRMRIEYQYFGLDGDFLGVRGRDDPSIDTFAIGLVYQLGRGTATVSSLR